MRPDVQKSSEMCMELHLLRFSAKIVYLAIT